MPSAFGGLVGLAAGFLLGFLLAAVPTPATGLIVALFATAGSLFVDLIRMTVLPLVTSLIVVGLGANRTANLGRAGLRAVIFGSVLVAGSVGLSLVIAPPILATIDVDREAAMALRNAATMPPPDAGPTTLPSTLAWVRSLVPTNVVRAAADDAFLPVILFAVFFGLALATVDEARRAPLVGLAQGVADTMQRLVGRVLRTAPAGIFALAVPLASGLGVSAAAAVFAYIGLVVGVTLVVVAVLIYPAGIAAGPLPASAFASYCLPSQSLAFSSRSSLATLPAMVDAATAAGLPTRALAVLPMALATCHVGAATAQTVGALFVARVFDIALGPTQVASMAVATFFASIAVPGVPGGSIIAMAPVLAAAGLPAEGLGILLAVDAVPDMFRTMANVTGALTVTAVAVAAEE
jgi:Na+/H+-dicarboxylate symporter